MGIGYVRGRLVSDKPTKYTLPVIRVNNACGECKACCTVLPIAHGSNWPMPDKPAGTPCKHLCEKGCGIWQQPEFPGLCKTYFCEWRDTRWLGEQPNLRPDKGGAIFQVHGDILAVFETFKGGAYTPEVIAAVKKYNLKYKGDAECLRVNVYFCGGITWTFGNGIQFTNTQASWYYQDEPYEHFVLDTPDKTRRIKNNAKVLLKFFEVRKHRESFVMEIKGDEGKEIKEIPRSQIPALQEVAKTGVVPEDMSWIDGVGMTDVRFDNSHNVLAA